MPFQFLNLPKEIQIHIIRYAIQPTIQPDIMRSPSRDGTKVSICEDEFAHLKGTCRAFYDIIDVLRPLKACPTPPPGAIATDGDERDAGRTLFSLRPQDDILRIEGHLVPRIWSKGRTRIMETSPIRRLMVVDKHPPKDAGTDHALDQPGSILKDHPNLQEFILGFMAADSSWDLRSFDRWLARSGRNCATAVEDTGIEYKWSLEFQNESMGIKWLPRTRRQRARRDTRTFIATIGYTWSYHIIRKSCATGYVVGGQWAGFRHYTKTGDTYFSPLSWSEVEGLCQRETGDGRDPVVFNDHHLQFIARTWIIPEDGQEPRDEPHHIWIKISEVIDGDAELGRDLTFLWGCVCSEMSKVRWDATSQCGYELIRK